MPYSPFVWPLRFLPLIYPSSRLPKYPVDVEPIREELADVLSSMTELANVRASAAISARSEQHTSLSLPEFLDLFNHSWNFVLKCEVICRRMIIGLRGVVVSQVCRTP
jgi:vacuolar protein sorting-associated protein 54